jgi:hypothetical protein
MSRRWPNCIAVVENCTATAASSRCVTTLTYVLNVNYERNSEQFTFGSKMVGRLIS